MHQYYLGVKDLAKIFGLGRTTIYRYIDEGRIPQPIKGPFVRKTWTRPQIERFQESML